MRYSTTSAWVVVVERSGGVQVCCGLVAVAAVEKGRAGVILLQVRYACWSETRIAFVASLDTLMLIGVAVAG